MPALPPLRVVAAVLLLVLIAAALGYALFRARRRHRRRELGIMVDLVGDAVQRPGRSTGS